MIVRMSPLYDILYSLFKLRLALFGVLPGLAIVILRDLAGVGLAEFWFLLFASGDRESF